MAQAKADDLRRAADANRLAHPRTQRERPVAAQRSVTLRSGTPADRRPLARLAELDSAAPPAQPVLLAEVDGQLRAALALTGGAVIADPFHPTADLIDLADLNDRTVGPDDPDFTHLTAEHRAAERDHRARRLDRLLRIAFLTGLLALVAASPAWAGTFVVDSGGDGNLTACSTAPNDCTLRGALTDSNATPGPNTIRLPALRIAVATPLPQITTPVTIKGVSARSSIIDGTAQVGTVLASVFGSHTVLMDLKVTGARRTPGIGDAAVAGGSLLQRVAVVDNQSTGVVASNTTILDSLIARNTGEGIGGVINGSTGAVISNSTVANNTAVLSGVAPLVGPLVWSGGVINAAGLLEIDHSTIAGNKVVGGAALLTGTNLGTVGVLDPSTVIRSSVIGAGASPNCGGPIDSNGHNVAADGSCSLTGAGDRANVDPLLAPLANNGGPTDTIALLPGSPAIDAGDACPAVDQRGSSRAQGKTCDAGAYESPFTAPTTASIRATTPPVTPTAPAIAPATTPPITASIANPARSRDRTPPKLRISRLAKTVTRKALRKGIKVRLGADEPFAAELKLLVAPRRVPIVREPVMALATLAMSPRGGGTRTVRIKPGRLIRGTRPIHAELSVVAYDAAANHSTAMIKFTIR
jgi:hypothetical protein